MNFGTATAAVTFVATTIGTLYGGATWIDGKYAHQEDLQLVEMRMEQKIEIDAIKETQNRIWTLEDRYKDRTMPPSVSEEYRQLKHDQDQSRYQLNGLQRQLNEMQYQRSKSETTGK